ncbi:oligopeptidase A [Congregibacter litoralis]|uniref:oligopeptidase A n=1 Tax=Congregibacter litoralis KT71 TaxID=314285 RepID=A4A4Z7_9GAMM|nr:oligopeptidase A [Congregibacter litoralis]EAQ98868.1 putative oligopeptidase [Congregibacter litoralis KT71]
MSNPLLADGPLPQFQSILPEHVEPAIDELLALNREQIIQRLESDETPSWENFVEPLELLDNRLSRAWSPVSHLNGVLNSEALREAHSACLAKLSDFSTEMGQNEALYEAYKVVAEHADVLNADQKKFLSNVLRDFKLSGVDLPEDKKQRYKEIQQSLSALSSDFSNKVLDAGNTWSKAITNSEELAGLPQTAMDLAKQMAADRGLEGYLLTLDFPSYLPVMTYADDAVLREEMYRAFATRASDEGPQAGEFDNTENMREILALRHEAAQLLGFNNYAERSLATKMARSTDEVMGFLNDLAQRSKAQAEAEFAELKAYAAEVHNHGDLKPWDVAYFSEKLRQHRHNISEEEVKPYFPVSRVIAGMFDVVGKLFSVSFHRVDDVETYHPDVSFYEIRDPDGSVRAQFYFDLCARQHKRGGAWMADCQSRMQTASFEQIPVAYMTCNFTPPVGDADVLLNHREVETLFHEFGHGLHHMLTRVNYPGIAGISGVAWDAVELPSQFMENYCWEREALDLFAAHHETGERIPEDLYERMIAAKNFQSGMMMVRQLEFALFDFRMHLEYDPATGDAIYKILDEVREQVAVVPAPAWNRFPHAFSHVFGGGYAAGYYSYKWAEVLSADAFSRFEEEGVFNEATGKRFLTSILERGGSDDAMNLFVDFRGREPKVDALLRHTGIAA